MNISRRTPVKAKASQIILFAFLCMSSIGLVGIFSGFDGLIVVKVGIQGGEITIDGRRDVRLPKNGVARKHKSA